MTGPQYSTPPPETTLAYAAGLFDGEGYIGITMRREKKNPTHRLVVAVCNTNRDVLVWLQETFRGNIFHKPRRSEQHTPTYQWVASGATAGHFLALVLPHLRIKRERAMIALAFQKPMDAKTSQGKVSGELFLVRESQRQRLKELNARAYLLIEHQ